MLERARTTIGDAGVELRIKSVGTWQINHVVATEYRYMHEMVPRPWDDGGMAAFRSPEIREGLTAFAEKRAPEYRKRT